ncbi:MAG: hypothetical protein Q8906_09820, partial [Bacillota bacterium]|nr:hypothetical protein [Bacillota bacterium]
PNHRIVFSVSFFIVGSQYLSHRTAHYGNSTKREGSRDGSQNVEIGCKEKANEDKNIVLIGKSPFEDKKF